MSRSLWRCHNPTCPYPHGATLGRITDDGGLVLDPGVRSFVAYLDTQRVHVTCPHCRMKREFRGPSVRRAG